ncbi:MAG TPA: YicC/YloC family endoribonuclease, partial [Blastocatellia bacterium]|nr:YicC/YloC family endoribonuclease [Blastocatellia bacterium]
MIKSMTGYGQGSADGEDFKVRVDVRTVNNRFLDVHLRLPQELASLEVTLKKQVQGGVRRGRVDLTISVDQMKQAKFEINRPLVSGYLSALSELKSEFGLGGEPSLELLAKLPGALQVSQDSRELDDRFVASVVAAVSQALVSLAEMRVV